MTMVKILYSVATRYINSTYEDVMEYSLEELGLEDDCTDEDILMALEDDYEIWLQSNCDQYMNVVSRTKEEDNG